MYAVEEHNLNGENQFIGASYFNNAMDAFDLAKKIDKEMILVYITRIYHDENGNIKNFNVWCSLDEE